MSATKVRSRKPKRSKRARANNGNFEACVLTLAEAASFLRVSESAVLAMVREQGLPARQIGTDWRFMKTALQNWLSTPPQHRERLLRHAGAGRDDPYLDEMLENIYRERGRPMVEEAK